MVALLREIKRHSGMTVERFCDEMVSHRHQISWAETSETEGFPGIDPSEDEDLWTDSAWQFALSEEWKEPECNWRVHGFLNQQVFYVVWLDPDHRLYGSN